MRLSLIDNDCGEVRISSAGSILKRWSYQSHAEQLDNTVRAQEWRAGYLRALDDAEDAEREKEAREAAEIAADNEAERADAANDERWLEERA